MYQQACLQPSQGFNASQLSSYYSISKTFYDTLNGIWLNPDNYDRPAALARRKITAVQIAIERVLGAPSGSLPLVDKDTVMAWFAD
jgi:hypothetical protein